MKKKSFEEQVRIYKEIAAHYGRDKSVPQLCRELGISKEDVSGAAYKLRKMGIDIPFLRMKGGSMGLAIDQLMSERPELFQKKVKTMRDDRISHILANRI